MWTASHVTAYAAAAEGGVLQAPQGGPARLRRGREPLRAPSAGPNAGRRPSACHHAAGAAPSNTTRRRAHTRALRSAAGGRQ
eukprot:1194844-Prorocentrum_minimum.AAC.9